MIYILIIAVALITAYFVFAVLPRRLLLRRMSEGVDMVKLGTFKRLKSLYTSKYGNDADLLAAAVVNELFSDQPGNERAAEFLNSHRDWVAHESKQLKDNIELCEVITQAVRVKATISFARGRIDNNQLLDPVERIKNLGILIPELDEPEPSAFLLMASEFIIASQAD